MNDQTDYNSFYNKCPKLKKDNELLDIMQTAECYFNPILAPLCMHRKNPYLSLFLIKGKLLTDCMNFNFQNIKFNA